MQVRSTALDLPLVDLRATEDDAVASLQRSAESHGFFLVAGHGVDAALVERVFAHSRAFFALPEERKEEVRSRPGCYGWDGLESETLEVSASEAEGRRRGDLKEGLYVGPEGEGAYKKTQWPHMGDERWKRDVQSYFAEMMRVGQALLRVVARALGLQRDFFEPHMAPNPMAVLRLLHYAPQPSDLEAGIIGCGPHTDYGVLTLLAIADGEPGLQVLHEGHWRSVAHVPDGAFVVNMGDCLQRWSNDRMHSTVHRVVIPPGRSKDRFSMAFFFEPDPNCVVECISQDGAAKYPPVRYADYFEKRMAQAYGEGY